MLLKETASSLFGHAKETYFEKPANKGKVSNTDSAFVIQIALRNQRVSDIKFLVIKEVQLINGKGEVELECHHFATLMNEWIYAMVVNVC